MKVNFLIIQVTRDYQSWICLPRPCKRSLKKFPWNDDLSSSEKLISMENLTAANLVTALWMHQLLQPNEQQSSHLPQSTQTNACNWNNVNIRLFKIITLQVGLITIFIYLYQRLDHQNYIDVTQKCSILTLIYWQSSLQIVLECLE